MTNEDHDLQERLERLGLKGLTPGKSTREAHPTSDRGRGFVPESAPSLAELAAHHTPVVLDSEASRQARFQVSRFAEAPDVWQFYHASHEAPSLHPAPPDEALEREQALVCLDLSALPGDEIALVVESTGEGLLVRRDAEGVILWPLHDRQGLHVPLESWLEDSADEELVAFIRGRTADDLRGRLVGAGMLARLEAPPEDEQAREQLVAQILAGDASLDAQRRWARQLTNAQVELLASQAHAATDELQARIQQSLVIDEPDSGLDDDDDDELEELCEARDDLECLRVLLLQHKEQGSALDTRLVELDRQGTELIERLEEDTLLHGSIRLERVALQRPGVWWVERLAWI